MKQNCWLKKERERERKEKDETGATSRGKYVVLAPSLVSRPPSPSVHDAINALNSDEFATSTTNWEDLWKLFTALLEIVRRMEFSCNSRPRPCVLETRRIFLRKPLPPTLRSPDSFTLFHISRRSFLVDRKWDLILTRCSLDFP